MENWQVTMSIPMNKIDPAWAWQPYVPTDANPWTVRKVGHLYRRAAFGANATELKEGLIAGPTRAVDALIKGGPGLAEFEAETLRWGESIRRTNAAPRSSEWWLYRMLYSPRPFQEKITLFWHNHFATSNAKVLSIEQMLGQYDLLYKHALGNFGDMLPDISRDPAMMIWLDTIQSKKGMPNENYARELMELFSLGIGHFSEQDIREAARAFTGWEIKGGKFFANAAQHDGSEKTVLGKTGKWTGDDIVRICLEQKACPQFIVRKLYRNLISESTESTADMLEPLAEVFGKDRDIGKLVERMLRSNLFFSPTSYRNKIKSPVEYVLGIVHGFEARIGVTEIARSLESLGQHLFHPPSVKGWDGGETWLNGQTLLTRQNLALELCESRTRAEGGNASSPLPIAVLNRHEAKPVDFFLNLFLQGDVPDETRTKLTTYADKAKSQSYPVYWSAERKAEHQVTSICHLALTLPEFQLG